MKKLLSIILALTMIVVPASAMEAKKGVLYKEGEVKLIEVNGQADEYYVPLRDVANILGVKIDWDKDENKATMYYQGNITEFKVNESHFYHNREQFVKESAGATLISTGRYETNLPNKIINGKLYVSSDFLGIVYGTVRYDETGFEVYEDWKIGQVKLDESIATKISNGYLLKISNYQEQKNSIKETLASINQELMVSKYEEIREYFTGVKADTYNGNNNLTIINKGEYVEVLILNEVK